MVSFPHCKINLGLKILRKREDGYHDLETVFFPLLLKDALEIVRSDKFFFSATGLPIPGDPAENLCIKAFHLLQADFPAITSVAIHLHKAIPIGAGLGGGSSDAAQILLVLNQIFHLQIDREQLLHYAILLGSDCPFFILDTPCLGAGRGERLEPIALDLSRYSFVIVNPRIHISTAMAFSLCQPKPDGKPVKEIISQPIGTWKNELINDFEEPLFRLHPSLRSVKDQLYMQGALYASLTGSGSGIFGIFDKGMIPSLIFEPDYEVVLLT